MRLLLAAAATATLAACAGTVAYPASADPAPQVARSTPAVTSNAPQPQPDRRIVFPGSVQQGALVIGKVPAGSQVRYDGRELRVTSYGTVVFGVERTQAGPVQVQVTRPDGSRETASIAVTPRDWPVEQVDGVPGKTVDPPPAIAERIAREQAAVTAARTRYDADTGFTQDFIWPVRGRISGRFGNQRVYNGTPGSAHSGMDIAAPNGTPVKAPAAGLVTFADDLYLTGGAGRVVPPHGGASNINDK